MKITKSKLKQLIKEELGQELSSDDRSKGSLDYLIDNLGTLDNVAQALRLVAEEIPEFMASFQAAHDYLIS